MWQNLLSKRAVNMKGSDIREAFKLSENASVISFAGGFPSPSSFPYENLKQISSVLLNSQALQYGPTEGLTELRKKIADLLVRDKISVDFENVLITSGSQQGLDLISKLFLNPGDVVFCEAPSYTGALNTFRNYEATFKGVTIDTDGILPKALEERIQESILQGLTPKLIYLVPCFQNPTGVTLSSERRSAVIELAEKYNLLILEDNPYGELYYDKKPPETLRSQDKYGSVIYLGSFSKVLIPGVRVGYIVGDKTLINRLAIAKQGTDLCSSSLSQMLTLEWLKTFSLDDHLIKIRKYYQEKRDTCLDACLTYLPENVLFTKPEGGFFVWLTFPSNTNARELLQRSISEAKVAFVPGGGFFPNPKAENYARISFSQIDKSQIIEGIQRLGNLLQYACSKRAV